MKYRRMLKRKIYATWVSLGRLRGCKIYIKRTLNGEYYFYQIVCENGAKYSSLESKDETSIRYTDFEECCKTAETWIKENY